MKCTFSLRRLGLVAHKHYAENRTSYLYGALALLGLLGLCAMLSLTGNVKHIASFEAMNVMIACVAPIAVAKLSLHDSMMTGKQIGYYTLPATDGEKFLFALLNTLVLSALAVATFEVVASIISDSIPQGHFHETALVGRWFEGGWVYAQLGLFWMSASMLAMSMAQDSPIKPMVLIIAILAIINFAPLVIFSSESEIFIQSLDVTRFTSSVAGTFKFGNSVLDFIARPFGYEMWWNDVWLPIILTIAAWFKFRERQSK